MQNKEVPGGQETVLLRYPLPKYDFQGRKLAKTPAEMTDKCRTNLIQETGLTTEVSKKHDSDHGLKNEKDAKNMKEKEIRTQNISVCSSVNNVQPISSSSSQTVQPQSNISSAVMGHRTEILSSNTSQSCTVSIDTQPVCVSCRSTKEKDNSSGFSEHRTIQVSSSSSRYEPAKSSGPGGSPSSQWQTQQAFLLNSNQESKLREENESLKSQLTVQLKVNSELKKLLIASVGEELETRVERLVRDKAELSEEVGGFTKKVTEDYENLDKISIQADMWRSKFLASRVMVEELASGRAFYAMQYQESQDALQQLLTERHEVRAHLLECYRVLQQVKGAFDPLNTHRSSHLPSTNVIDLSKQAHQLAEAIRFRLLPGQLNLQTVIDIDSDSEMTHAERFAQDLVSRPINPDAVPCSASSSFKLFGPECSRIDRFHPEVNFENLTFNCCAQCKGEINVV
ncbi:golgin-45-like [Gigantopelta aegis]|uniref:golgin-45-like n=1 Tax=Gigantopelta aegis TaxID=1735272 RepID=UPI001B88DDD1|nr:golgin-45-like [Gigantopelta aegis]XP_041347044.1 golgin-45-like [Gigantopelta aegis]